MLPSILGKKTQIQIQCPLKILKVALKVKNEGQTSQRFNCLWHILLLSYINFWSAVSQLLSRHTYTHTRKWMPVKTIPCFAPLLVNTATTNYAYYKWWQLTMHCHIVIYFQFSVNLLLPVLIDRVTFILCLHRTLHKVASFEPVIFGANWREVDRISGVNRSIIGALKLCFRFQKNTAIQNYGSIKVSVDYNSTKTFTSCKL